MQIQFGTTFNFHMTAEQAADAEKRAGRKGMRKLILNNSPMLGTEASLSVRRINNTFVMSTPPDAYDSFVYSALSGAAKVFGVPQAEIDDAYLELGDQSLTHDQMRRSFTVPLVETASQL